MKNDFQGGSRYNYRAKRKKTNLILNSLIVIVLLLIVFVSYSIFFSGNDKTAANKDVQSAAEKTTAQKAESEKQPTHKIKENKSTSTEKSSSSDAGQQMNDTNVQTGQEKSTAASSSEDVNNANQLQTVDSPDPNAGAQATTGGQHVTSYDTNSQDWQEMLQAMSAATGIDQSNMTVWFLGSDRSTPNGSVGTISAKDTKQKYRVYLQWVDGQGWKATKVENLSQ